MWHHEADDQLQSVTPALAQVEEAQEVNPGAAVTVVIGEPERAVHSLAGEAGGCGSFPGAVGEGHGIAVGKWGVQLEAVDGEDGDGEDGGDVVVVAPDDVVTSCPSYDPWM